MTRTHNWIWNRTNTRTYKELQRTHDWLESTISVIQDVQPTERSIQTLLILADGNRVLLRQGFRTKVKYKIGYHVTGYARLEKTNEFGPVYIGTRNLVFSKPPQVEYTRKYPALGDLYRKVCR